MTATPTCRTAARLPRWHLGAWAGWLALLLGAWIGPARAGPLPGELPALVGRLEAVGGEVLLADRDTAQWVRQADDAPLRNWPVTGGDRVRTGPGARAELRLGSTTVRLGAGAELWLEQADEQALVLRLQAGSVAVRLGREADAFGAVELRTREGRWLPQRPGHYRLDRESDATQASTWRGELRFEGHDSALTVAEQRRADIWLDGPGRRATTRYAWAEVARDGFADWVARDERQDEAPLAARHVSPAMTGWQDLDRHGDWVDDDAHGALWLPRQVAPGWRPYQDGRWAWVAPWGWTWIDAAPWGFAPFHYGSWLQLGGRWAWSPGPRGHRARFEPVLGAWIGGPVVGIHLRIGGGHRPAPPRVVVPVVVNRPWHPRPGWDHRPPPSPRDGRWAHHPPHAQPPHADDRRPPPPRSELPDVRRPWARDPQPDHRRDDGRAQRDDRRDDRRGDHPADRRGDRRAERPVERPAELSDAQREQRHEPRVEPRPDPRGEPRAEAPREARVDHGDAGWLEAPDKTVPRLQHRPPVPQATPVPVSVQVPAVRGPSAVPDTPAPRPPVRRQGAPADEAQRQR